MGQGGLEPPTPRLSSVCSNQLSYWPQSHKGGMDVTSIRGASTPANPAGNTRLQTKPNLLNRTKPVPPNPFNKIGIRGQRPGREPSQAIPYPRQSPHIQARSPQCFVVCVFKKATCQDANRPKPHPRQGPLHHGRHEQASYVCKDTNKPNKFTLAGKPTQLINIP